MNEEPTTASTAAAAAAVRNPEDRKRSREDSDDGNFLNTSNNDHFMQLYMAQVAQMEGPQQQQDQLHDAMDDDDNYLDARRDQALHMIQGGLSSMLAKIASGDGAKLHAQLMESVQD
jgi:hypothetical protein